MANQLYGYSHSNYGAAATTPNHPLSLSLSLSSVNPSSYSSSAMLYNTGTAADYSAVASWPTGYGYDTSASAIDPLGSGLKRPSDALYHQTVLGAHNTIGQTEAWYSALAKRPRYDSASTLPVYPQRPGEKDCAHYMLSRTCKFGETCKFDHPIWVPEGGIPDWKEVPVIAAGESLPERPGEPDCPYFLKTQRCKYGVRCKFNHPKDKMPTLGVLENADVSVLPERPSEPPCAFYVKTGKCKFGVTCKFNHPKDIQILSTEKENGHNGQAVTAVSNDGTSGYANIMQPLFTPALLHNSKGLPVRPGEAECPFYLKTGSCKYGATCRYSHPDRNVIYPVGMGQAMVASPAAAHLNVGAVNPAASVLQTIDPRLTYTTFGLGPAVYPQRPGQTECDYYMKTGECKFGERCKYHHPIDRSAPPASTEVQQQNVKLTLAGLPRREGAIICPYYLKTGTCKYGATCKFDHPPPGEVMALATSQSASATAVAEAETVQ